MQEILIGGQPECRKIALMQDGVMQEYYEEQADHKRLEGNIYLGRVVDVLPGMQAAFVDIGQGKNTYIHLKDILPKVSSVTGNKKEDMGQYTIQNFLKKDRPILVQVKKDSIHGKGARISTHIHIPGRFVVLLTENTFITVSQKIEEETERQRLIEMAEKSLGEDREVGIIIRTAAQGKPEEVIQKDIADTLEKWKQIQNKAKEMTNEQVPVPLWEQESILERLLLDLVDNHLERILVEEEQMKGQVEDILKLWELQDKISIEVRVDIFHVYDWQEQIEKMNRRKIWLPCGGFITIDQTEALTAIDVNSGKYTGKESLEQTVVKVNTEASIEIAKQLRLRDIGGIIVIDYIDMQEKISKQQIIEVLRQNLKKDRAKNQIMEFTKLNLLEMTRKHMWSK
ncbi:MAG: Rne/Rng family ribonuclease [Clostridia bacterium]